MKDNGRGVEDNGRKNRNGRQPKTNHPEKKEYIVKKKSESIFYYILCKKEKVPVEEL